MGHLESQKKQVDTVPESLYKALDFVVVRAPLLPIESYLNLGQYLDTFDLQCQSFSESPSKPSLLPEDPQIRLALAVGSISLINALEQPPTSDRRLRKLRRKYMRYLIRMSTRATPFGLFAGVALAQWGAQTDLEILPKPYRRTRPDMAWLLHFVSKIESKPEIRKHLNYVVNPTALIHSGRVSLSECMPKDESDDLTAVSIRATGVVKQVLSLARQPISYYDLFESLITTPGATEQKVEILLTSLWEQTILLTDLRPPLTTRSPAQYIAERLANIPEAQGELKQLKSILQEISEWDSLEPDKAFSTYRQLVDSVNNSGHQKHDIPLQTDMGLEFNGKCITHSVAEEVEKAAELLLTLAPYPSGLPQIREYRQAFESHYSKREIPLLELLDPDIGLGSLKEFTGTEKADVYSTPEHSKTLIDLILTASIKRQRVIELDQKTLSSLQTCFPSTISVPTSLDINVLVAASSREAMDRGDFQIVMSPNLGADSAGRMLGRFADLLGPEASDALKSVTEAEAEQEPGLIWVELVYMPRKFRLANVVVRPVSRSHEIVFGVSPGIDPSMVIPLDELSVGIRRGRLYVRWTKQNKELRFCNGHMLNSLFAPDAGYFLTALQSDGIAQFNAFDWGKAKDYRFLPRLQMGRIVLHPAEWKIDSTIRDHELQTELPEKFHNRLQTWRASWQLPRYIFMGMSDNRLLLDLDDVDQTEELRKEILNLPESGVVQLQEAIPNVDELWAKGSTGVYLTELVVPLILKDRKTEPPGKYLHAENLEGNGTLLHTSILPVPKLDRLKIPGSDWLFIKLYCRQNTIEDFISGPLKQLTEEVISNAWAERWFYIRYSDPDHHIRLRFWGDPEILSNRLMPFLCTWSNNLMRQELCLHFQFDSYDREIERYGGLKGMELSEKIFCIDSHAVSKLKFLEYQKMIDIDPLELAVVSVNNLLTALIPNEEDRYQWLNDAYYAFNEKVASEFRQRKQRLRSMLGGSHLGNQRHGAKIIDILKETRININTIFKEIVESYQTEDLSVELESIYDSYIHLHCNRLLGVEKSQEETVLGLLSRIQASLNKAPYTN